MPDETPNPIAGKHKHEIWAEVEAATGVDELETLDTHLAHYGYDANGRVRTRIAERIKTLTGA